MRDRSMEFFIQGETLEEIIPIQEQKVISEVCIHMEFLSCGIGIDEPSEVMDVILDSMDEYYTDFPSVNEYFERREHNKIEGETEKIIGEFNQRLKFAIQEHVGFLSNFLEIDDFDTLMMMFDLLLYRAFLEYVPMREEI